MREEAQGERREGGIIYVKRGKEKMYRWGRGEDSVERLKEGGSVGRRQQGSDG